MQLPVSLIESLHEVKGFDKEAFEKVHHSGEQVTSIRINPLKKFSTLPANSFGNPVFVSQIPWTQYGYYLSERPSFTFDPLFHAGTYYVQEASSMFLEEALKQTVDLSAPLKILDLSAAPGGKSTHIHSLISPQSLLVSNDVIRSRANILKDNIIKWGAENVVVTNNDPKEFSSLVNYFDVIVVDAPCSGSGLFRRDPGAIEEWSENNVALCSQRQRRILADIWPALKQDGILIYSTCSYSKEEDEAIMDWMAGELEIQSKKLEIRKEWGIVETLSGKDNIGYRFWPDKVKGEGFFISVFQKLSGGSTPELRYKKKIMQAGNKELELIGKWVETEGRTFVRHEHTVYAWPAALTRDMNILLERLRVIYSGVLVGELIRDKLVPDHALAMSEITGPGINRMALAREQAIMYLQRKELVMETFNKGWQLVTYQDRPIGWINALPNRINNYYPKELRILKES